MFVTHSSRESAVLRGVEQPSCRTKAVGDLLPQPASPAAPFPLLHSALSPFHRLPSAACALLAALAPISALAHSAMHAPMLSALPEARAAPRAPVPLSAIKPNDSQFSLFPLTSSGTPTVAKPLAARGRTFSMGALVPLTPQPPSQPSPVFTDITSGEPNTPGMKVRHAGTLSRGRVAVQFVSPNRHVGVMCQRGRVATIPARIASY